jgi:hypothetical protein
MKQRTRRRVLRLSVVAFALTAMCAAIWPAHSGAHKAITSKYTYHQHVFPILKERCGRCHRDGGIAPMSLLQYQEAMPWAEAMRGELLSNRMPPWNADPAFGSLKGPQSLSAQELDVLLTWASGGSPAGAAPAEPPPPPTDEAWPLGAPDAVLQMPAPVTIASDTRERDVEVVVPTSLKGERWIRAIDLKPGTPSIVRSATFAIRTGSRPASARLADDAELRRVRHSGPSGRDGGEPAERETGVANDTVIATWLPGQSPVPLEGGAAYRLPAGASLVLRIHYRKTWRNESDEVNDRSAVGLYFATAAGARDVQRLTIAVPATASLDTPVTFTQTIDRQLQLVAIRAEGGPPNLTVQAVAVAPGGSRTPLIRMVVRPEWPRQYAFASPVRLAQGSRIEVTTTPSDASLWESITGEPPAPAETAKPLTLALSVVTSVGASGK